MSLSCFKNCKKGDAIYLIGSSTKHLATQDYISVAHPYSPPYYNSKGHIPTLNSSLDDGFIMQEHIKYITKIVKAKQCP